MDDGLKVDINKCKEYANKKQAEEQKKIEETLEVIDTSNLKDQNDKIGVGRSARIITSQSQASSLQVDPISNSYHF